MLVVVHCATLDASDRSEQSIAARLFVKRGAEVPKGTGSLDRRDLYVSESGRAQLLVQLLWPMEIGEREPLGAAFRIWVAIFQTSVG